MKYWYEKYKVTRNWQDYIYRTPGNIVSERLENLRGKLVLIFDGQHTSLDPALGLHKFSKYEDTNSTPAQGLTTCGTYAASSKVKVVAEKAKEAALRHFNGHARDHLHFVYYQQTMMLESIESATTAKKEKELFSGKKKDYTGGARTNMPKFLADLHMMASDQGADLAHYANVISHDFVDPTTCRQIIGLNKDFQW